MIMHRGLGQKIVTGFIYLVLIITALLCILPLINVLAVSLSSSAYATAGQVKLWPVGFTWNAYSFVSQKKEFLYSMLVSIKRVGLGVSINMLLTVLVAYPLSKENAQFRMRTWYVWIFIFTMLFSGGLIPLYLVIKELHLINTMWSLVLPGAVPIYNVVLMINFFRSLPKELHEAAYIDGANHWKTLSMIIIPLSAPALATMTLFSIVAHWNAWFDGLIYMNSPHNYPLASYLQTIIIGRDLSSLNLASDLQALQNLSDRTVKAAQIFVGALPILLVYPFLQRFFMTGIVVGSVKE